MTECLFGHARPVLRIVTWKQASHLLGKLTQCSLLKLSNGNIFLQRFFYFEDDIDVMSSMLINAALFSLFLTPENYPNVL